MRVVEAIFNSVASDSYGLEFVQKNRFYISLLDIIIIFLVRIYIHILFRILFHLAGRTAGKGTYTYKFLCPIQLILLTIH